MKKYISMIVAAAMLLCVLAGCGCSHEWADATCEAPKTCTLCGETEGEALGHQFGEATCVSPSTCAACGMTQGEALEHKFGEATCASPSTCADCGATQGEVLPHTLSEANYQSGPLCTVCGAVQGEPLTAGYEELGITLNQVELGVPVTLTIKNTKFEFLVESDEVFAGDDDHEAVDGYVWHKIKFTLTALEKHSALGHNVPSYSDFSDYYTPVEQTASVVGLDSNTLLALGFSANYLGEDYPDCVMHLAKSHLNNDGQWNYTETICFRIPEGYDGILMGLGDAKLMNGSYDSCWQAFYGDANTAIYRVG